MSSNNNKSKVSILYRHIECLHGNREWGDILDAGTGINSIRWLSKIQSKSLTAVTGSNAEANLTSDVLESPLRPQDRVLIGNWIDPKLLQNQVFDTVIADYLLGAIEGFSPYFQPYLFKRLRPLTRNVLYVTGLEPYVPTIKPSTQAGRIIWEIGRFRDACVLLKGGVPYREYPLPWVVDQLKVAGFDVRTTKHFGIGYKKLFVDAQINIAVSGLERLDDKVLSNSLVQKANSLRADALSLIDELGALRACQNYVIEAVPTLE